MIELSQAQVNGIISQKIQQYLGQQLSLDLDYHIITKIAEKEDDSEDAKTVKQQQEIVMRAIALLQDEIDETVTLSKQQAEGVISQKIQQHLMQVESLKLDYKIVTQIVSDDANSTEALNVKKQIKLTLQAVEFLNNELKENGE